MELVEHEAATKEEDKAEDTDEVFVEVAEVMIEAVEGVCSVNFVFLSLYFLHFVVICFSGKYIFHS